MSNALIKPCNAVSATISDSVITCASVSAASASDCTAAAACVATSSFLRSSRSTHTPANGPTINETICPAKLTTPSSNTECVIRYTSQLVASFVIQLPITEVPWPKK